MDAYWKNVDCILVLDTAYVSHILAKSVSYGDLDPSLIKYLGSRLLTKQGVDAKLRFGCYIEVFVDSLALGKEPDVFSLQYAGIFFNSRGRIHFKLYPTKPANSLNFESNLGFDGVLSEDSESFQGEEDSDNYIARNNLKDNDEVLYGEDLETATEEFNPLPKPVFNKHLKALEERKTHVPLPSDCVMVAG